MMFGELKQLVGDFLERIGTFVMVVWRNWDLTCPNQAVVRSPPERDGGSFGRKVSGN